MLFRSMKTLCSHLCVQHLRQLSCVGAQTSSSSPPSITAKWLRYATNDTTATGHWLSSFPSRVQEVFQWRPVTWSNSTEEFLLLCGLAGLVASFNPQLGQDLRGTERPLTAAAPPKTCFSCPAEAPRVGKTPLPCPQHHHAPRNHHRPPHRPNKDSFITCRQIFAPLPGSGGPACFLPLQPLIICGASARPSPAAQQRLL